MLSDTILLSTLRLNLDICCCTLNFNDQMGLYYCCLTYAIFCIFSFILGPSKGGDFGPYLQVRDNILVFKKILSLDTLATLHFGINAFFSKKY